MKDQLLNERALFSFFKLWMLYNGDINDCEGRGRMGINWSKLFTLQHELDSRIMEEHRLTGDLLEERLLALQVEVGELANETRCFKYWSVKQPSERTEILEEYVDGIHFILSLGLTLGFQTHTPEARQHEDRRIVEQFLAVFNCISQLYVARSIETYSALFSEYLVLGSVLGFTEEEIEAAYFEKNSVNHERQDKGY